jgi:hypothetical protein
MVGVAFVALACTDGLMVCGALSVRGTSTWTLRMRVASALLPATTGDLCIVLEDNGVGILLAERPAPGST